MSSIPGDLRYTKNHEWVRLGADGNVTMGITDHAQELMGEIVMVELPWPVRTSAPDRAPECSKQ